MAGFISPLYVVRRDAVASTLSLTDLVSMNARELLALQSAIGAGNVWGSWAFPAEFMPDGQLQKFSQRSCSIEQFECEGEADDVKTVQAWTEIVRYGVIRSLVQGVRVLAKPSSVITEMQVLVRFVRKILAQPHDPEKFWSRLAESELAKVGHVAKSIVGTLKHYHSRGYIADCLREDTQVVGLSPERDRYNESDVELSREPKEAWLPLPDSFTSECGWRSIKIIKTLGPALLSALEAAILVVVRTRMDGKPLHVRNHQVAVAEARNAVIEGWHWQGQDGMPITYLDFDLMMKESKGRSMVFGQQLPMLHWPPKTFADAWSLLALLQAAHLFPVCLSSGPRASEVSGFTVNCLVEGVAGTRIHAKTYKLITGVGGRDRDFNAPELVVEALLQQIRLAKLVKKRAGIEGDHLWVHVRAFGRGRMGEKHVLLSRYLDDYATKLNVRAYLDGKSHVHIHRFRKTLARIVALSLMNSPMVLMDCFGHEDPDMTIRSYILSDKGIAREVLSVQKEMMIIMAVDIISDSENLGGAVGEQLRQRKAACLQLLGKSEFEPQDAYEFAARETFDGRSWMMVSPGVYCTLPAGNGGACAKGQDGKNPAYCRSGCPFQLLTAVHKDKCDAAVKEIVLHLEKAEADGEMMLVGLWAGQLKNWLHRWPDIADRWRLHPLVEAYGKVHSSND
ncbi:MAG: hypothetical protein ACN6PW_02830 [Pseudomonas kermanshahensis]|uniref:hypothetical protein n=1 Tax=Pseudomonas kermanshahensis TaxID=2745482 RepID=UPI003D0DA515